MAHAGDPAGIMKGLCRLERQLRRNDARVYAIYSTTIHDPLHAFMNQLLDEGSRRGRGLVRAENALEISLLSEASRAEKLRSLAVVVRMVRPALSAAGHEHRC